MIVLVVVAGLIGFVCGVVWLWVLISVEVKSAAREELRAKTRPQPADPS
jgi:hypothetical protein